MINSIRIRLIATTAATLAILGGAVAQAGANSTYQPFVTDFPKATASTTFTPFVTDFGVAPRPGAAVIRSTKPTSSVRATSPVRAAGRDWADVGLGAGLGVGFAAALAAAAGLGVRRRRSSVEPIAALRAGTAE